MIAHRVTESIQKDLSWMSMGVLLMSQKSLIFFTLLSSPSDKTGIIIAATTPLVAILFFIILTCCIIWIRRRSLARQAAAAAPTRTNIATRIAVIRAVRSGARTGDPVPQQNDKPIFIISTLPTPAQPKTGQAPKTMVKETEGKD